MQQQRNTFCSVFMVKMHINLTIHCCNFLPKSTGIALCLVVHYSIVSRVSVNSTVCKEVFTNVALVAAAGHYTLQKKPTDYKRVHKDIIHSKILVAETSL
jgi:hypothetical protein